MLAAARLIAVKACAISVLAAALAGIPAWLITTIGWPLPTQLPDSASLAGTLNGTITDQMILDVIAIGIWLAWAAFTHAIAVEAIALKRGRASLRRARNPLRGLATVLIGAAFMGTVISATAATGTAAANAAAAPAKDVPLRPAAVIVAAQATSGPATIVAGEQRYTYTVVRGDYLSKIAGQWLGDANRWPEICNLNKHKHFPKAGGTLTDCNLIYPGWELVLPQDATPPAAAVPVPAIPAEPTPVLPPGPIATPPPELTPSPAASASPKPSTPAATPSATQPAPSSPTPATSTTTPAETPAAEPNTTDEQGISLPGNTWLPWSFAIAVTAAASAVWIQRRRRFRGDLDGEPVTDMPPVVNELRRAVHANPHITLPADDAGKAAAVPELAPLPSGGIGLLGDGAQHAARAAITETLAAGGPLHPGARGEVVIDAGTLATLIGPDAITLGPWPRLHIADSIEHALTLVEERLLHRSRLLDEYQLSDVDTLAAQEPAEEPLPPILLLTHTPPAGTRQRAKITFSLGHGLGVSALLLGEWPYGPTLTVSTDGNTEHTSGNPQQGLPSRMPVLSPDDAVAILATLREAHTGQPAAAATTVTESPVTLKPPQAETLTVEDHTPLAGAAQKAVLRILGKPHIGNTTGSSYHLRGKSLELAVYLACHRDGKTVPQLVDDLEANGRAHQAEGRVHTHISNLRRGLAAYSGFDHKYLIKDDARRHKLDPATVDVDLWQLQALLSEARTAPDDTRTGLLRQACDLYAPLAEGESYDWLTPHAEAARRLGLHAHLKLAEYLTADGDHHGAVKVLDAAIVIDPYNENVYTQAMRARHTTGDAEGIRHLMRALVKALSDVDAEPAEETTELARQLRASLEHK